MEAVKVIGKTFDDFGTKVALGCAFWSKVPFRVDLSKTVCCSSSAKQGPFKDISHAVTLEVPGKGTFCGHLTIARYFVDLCECIKSEKFLFERCDISSWMEFFFERLLLPAACPGFEKVAGPPASNVCPKYAEFYKTLAAVDAFLALKTYLVCECPSHADLYLVLALERLENDGKLEADLVEKQFLNLARHRRTVRAQDRFEKFDKVLKLLKESGPVDGVVDVVNGGLPQAKVESNFSLEAFKRLYSNCKGDLRLEVIPELFATFDPQNFTFYLMKYNKLPEECQNEIMTSNMLSGFLQRFEPEFRKLAFGVINILGSEGDFNIVGVFLMQGTSLPQSVLNHPSYEFHTFTKLDPSVEKDRLVIEDYFCNSDDVQGVPIADCKVFK